MLSGRELQKGHMVPQETGLLKSKPEALCAVGPRLGNSPVPSIVQCLARKDGTDDFYQLKVSEAPGAGEAGAPGAALPAGSPPLPHLHTRTTGEQE